MADIHTELLAGGIQKTSARYPEGHLAGEEAWNHGGL